MIIETRFVRSSGLGNRLFPWARARLLARDTGADCVRPKWHDIRRGPLLRGGVNYRTFVRKILLFDNFDDDPGDLPRSRLRSLRRSARCLGEADARQGERGDRWVTVQGDGNFFEGLHENHAYLEDALWRVTRDKWKALVMQLPTFDITLNVRCGGDFSTPKSDLDFVEKGLVLTPAQWFADLVQRIRAENGSQVGVQVVSDGTREDLRPILRLPNTHFCETPAAISDLWAVRRSRMIIATGGSSFPAWAAFFARCPVVSIEGQSFSWFRLDRQSEFPVLTMRADNADASEMRRINEALERSSGEPSGSSSCRISF